MDALQISGKWYISSRRAAKEHGYHVDYIGQLVRGGKVKGQKVGRAWYVLADSLTEYLEGEGASEQPKSKKTSATSTKKTSLKAASAKKADTAENETMTESEGDVEEESTEEAQTRTRAESNKEDARVDSATEAEEAAAVFEEKIEEANPSAVISAEARTETQSVQQDTDTAVEKKEIHHALLTYLQDDRDTLPLAKPSSASRIHIRHAEQARSEAEPIRQATPMLHSPALHMEATPQAAAEEGYAVFEEVREAQGAVQGARVWALTLVGLTAFLLTIGGSILYTTNVTFIP